MRVRCYPEGRGDITDSYTIAPGDIGMCDAPVGAVPRPERVSAALASVAGEYAEEWFDEPSSGEEKNICVEPDDKEAEALPGWHAPEDASEYNDEAPRPFRMFIVRARVEVEWSAREVAIFNP